MTLSRFLAALSFVGTLATTAAAALQFVRPSWAVWALGITGAINAFTERVQGGKSNAELNDTLKFPPKE